MHPAPAATAARAVTVSGRNSSRNCTRNHHNRSTRARTRRAPRTRGCRSRNGEHPQGEVRKRPTVQCHPANPGNDHRSRGRHALDVARQGQNRIPPRSNRARSCSGRDKPHRRSCRAVPLRDVLALAHRRRRPPTVDRTDVVSTRGCARDGAAIVTLTRNPCFRNVYGSGRLAKSGESRGWLRDGLATLFTTRHPSFFIERPKCARRRWC